MHDAILSASNATCPERHYTQRLFASSGAVVLIIGVAASVASIVVWTSLIRRHRGMTVTVWATVLVVIEATNIFLLVVDGFRYVVPAFMVVLGGKCDAGDMVFHYPIFWRQMFPYLWGTFYPLEQVALFAHQWIHLLLSTERYLHVCQPFKIRRQLTRRRALAGVGAIVAASTACCVPYWFEYRIRVYRDKSRCYGVDYCAQSTQTTLREDACYILLYRIAFHVLVKYLVPWTLVTLQTAAVVRVLKRISNSVVDDSNIRGSIVSVSSVSLGAKDAVGGTTPRRKRGSIGSGGNEAEQSTLSSKLDRKVTNLCFAIVFMFFICQLPHGIWLALSGFTLPYGRGQNLGRFQCAGDTRGFLRVHFVNGSAGATSGVDSADSVPRLAFRSGAEGERRRRWRATSPDLPQRIYWRFNDPIASGVYKLVFNVELDCSHILPRISCFRFDALTSVDDDCGDWEARPALDGHDRAFDCCDRKWKFFFVAREKTRCFGVRVTRGDVECRVNATVTNVILYRHQQRTVPAAPHKNLAVLVYDMLEDYVALGTILLLLLTPTVDLVIFSLFYPPFQTELRRIFIPRIMK